MLDIALRNLKYYYGYDSFRKGQDNAIENVLKGKDTFVIMPTGGGKSLTYQIPATILRGVTLVISPLISLMKDQVDSLNDVGIKATFINSTLKFHEVKERVWKIFKGEYKIVYIAPERLSTTIDKFIEKNIKIDLVAVDEAHCVSKWGYDFRPSYLEIASSIKKLPYRPIMMACTATATDVVRDDIIKLLELNSPTLYFTSFERKNLTLKVYRDIDKIKFIDLYIRSRINESGIIYAATRKRCEELYDILDENGLEVGLYHGGMNENERKEMQEAFMYDRVNVIVATTAFGMGIDKSNVRYVIHYNVPKNIESYYQEAGRAGRDGEESECILLFDEKDKHIQEFLIDKSDMGIERKAIEMKNLDAMLDYCYTTNCLSNSIVEYFENKDLDICCNKCNNCIEEDFAKMLGRLRKRASEQVYIEKEVLQNSDVKNDKFLNQQNIKSDLDKTMSEETIKDSSLKHNLQNNISLNSRDIQNDNVDNKNNYINSNEQLSNSDLLLFEDLRKVRKVIANELGFAPYIIFHDSTLKEIARIKPLTFNTFANIRGVGRSKTNKYGLMFAKVIKAHLNGENNTSDEFIRNLSINYQAEDNVKSYIITHSYYKNGMSISEIATKRGLSEKTVLDHLFEGVEKGLEIDLDFLIPKEYENLMIDIIKKVGSKKLRPIKDLLPENIEYASIKAVIYKHKL